MTYLLFPSVTGRTSRNCIAAAYTPITARFCSREAPHVLVFQITAVGIGIDLNGQLVFAFQNIGCYIELGRRHRILTITHFMTVDP